MSRRRPGGIVARIIDPPCSPELVCKLVLSGSTCSRIQWHVDPEISYRFAGYEVCIYGWDRGHQTHIQGIRKV